MRLRNGSKENHRGATRIKQSSNQTRQQSKNVEGGAVWLTDMMNSLVKSTHLQAALGIGTEEEENESLFFMHEHRKPLSVRQTIQQGLFGALAKVANLKRKRAKQANYILFVKQFVLLLQLLTFTFDHASFAWPSWVNGNIGNLLRVSNFSFVRASMQGATMGVFLLSGAVALFVIVGYVSIGFYSTKGVESGGWFAKALCWCADPFTTILFLPVIDHLLAIYEHCESSGYEQSHSFYQCGGMVHMLMKISVGPLALVFLGLCCMTVLTNYDRNILSSDITAKAHGRVECFNLIVMFVLTFLRVVFRSNTAIMCAIIILSSLAMVVAYVYYLPYYDQFVNKIYAAPSACFFWSSICLVIQLILLQSHGGLSGHFGSAVAFLAGLPAVTIATFAVIDWRIEQLRKKSLQTVESPMIFEVATRLQFSPQVTKWNEVVDIYRNGVERFKSGYLLIYFTQILADWGKNYLLAAQIVGKAKDYDLLLDDQYLVFKQRLDEDKRNAASGTGNINYIAFEKHKTESERRIIEATEIVNKIWIIFRSKDAHSDVVKSELEKLSIRFRNATMKANFHLEELMRVSKGTSAQAYEMYASFLEDIMNDKYSATMLRRKMEEDLVDACGEHDGEREENVSRAMVTVDGTAENLGVVVDVSSETCSLLGYQKHDLIGKNISFVCPPPFDKMHDMFLERFLETNTEFVTVTRSVWARHKSGYVLPLKLTVTPVLDPNGDMMFSGRFAPNMEYHAAFFCIEVTTYDILFASKAAYECILETKAPSFGAGGGGAVPAAASKENLKSFMSEAQLESKDTQDLLHGTNGQTKEIRFQNSLTPYQAISTYHSFSVQVRDKIPFHSSFAVVQVLLNPEMEALYSAQKLTSVMQQPLSPGGLNGTSSFKMNGSGPLLERNGSFNSRTSAAQRSCVQGNRSEASFSVFSSASRQQRQSVFFMVEHNLINGRQAVGKKALVISVLMCLIVTFVEWIIRSNIYAMGMDSLRQVRNSMDRAFTIVDTSLKIQTLQIYLDQNVGYVENETEVGELLADIDETLHHLDQLHIRITESPSLAGFGPLRAQNSERLVNIRKTGPIGPDYTNVNLLVGVHEFHANTFAYLSKFPVRNCSKNCQYILNNGAGSIFAAGMEASELFLDATKDAISDAETYEMVNLILVSIFSCLGITLFILPLVLSLWDVQAKTIAALLSLPRIVSRQLHEDVSTRLRSLKRVNAAPQSPKSALDQQPPVKRKITTVSEEHPEDRDSSICSEIMEAKDDQLERHERQNDIEAPIVAVSPNESKVEEQNEEENNLTNEPPQQHKPLLESIKTFTDLKVDNSEPNEGPSPTTDQSSFRVRPSVTTKPSQITLNKDPIDGIMMNASVSSKLRKTKKKVTPTTKSKTATTGSVKDLAELELRKHLTKPKTVLTSLVTLTKGLLLSVFVLGLPFVVTIGYFLLAYFLEAERLNDRVAVAEVAHLSGKIWVQANLVAFYILSEYGSRIGEWSQFHNNSDVKLNLLHQACADLAEAHSRFTYSEEKQNMNDDGSELFSLIYENACLTKCEEYPASRYYSSLRNGLQIGFETFETWIDDQKEKISLESNEEQFRNLTFADLYHEISSLRGLMEALERSFDSSINNFGSLIDQQLMHGRLYLFGYLILLGLGALTSYRFFLHLDNQVHNIQYLILLIPERRIKESSEFRSLFSFSRGDK